MPCVVQEVPKIEVPLVVLSEAVQSQVTAYDQRFRKGLEEAVRRDNSAGAQVEAFGKRDATGVESVHDMMPTEKEVFEQLLREVYEERQPPQQGAHDIQGERNPAPPVTLLDFGCGDGRYLRQYVSSAGDLCRTQRCGLHVVAYEVSAEALHSFHFHARQAGLRPRRVTAEPVGDPDAQDLPPLHLDEQLTIEFILGSGQAGTQEVAKCLRSSGSSTFDLVVIGWGTLSSIPRLPDLSPESLLAMLAQLARRAMNVASTTNNHIKFQRQCEARRRAYNETDNAAVRAWLWPRIGLANFPGSYYYRVDTGQLMFYAAITAAEEEERLKAAGFGQAMLRICNVINFFDIQTKPRASRLNAAVIRLLERRDVWGAQLLLSRAVAKAFGRRLSALNTTSCIFDDSSRHALYGQVARYFISTGVSSMVSPR